MQDFRSLEYIWKEKAFELFQIHYDDQLQLKLGKPLCV